MPCTKWLALVCASSTTIAPPHPALVRLLAKGRQRAPGKEAARSRMLLQCLRMQLLWREYSHLTAVPMPQGKLVLPTLSADWACEADATSSTRSGGRTVSRRALRRCRRQRRPQRRPPWCLRPHQRKSGCLGRASLKRPRVKRS